LPIDTPSLGTVLVPNWEMTKEPTDVGGVRELVADRAGGAVVRPNDAADLAAALEKYLASPQIACAAGAHNRLRATNEFSWRTSALRLLDVYDRVVSARQDAARASA